MKKTTFTIVLFLLTFLTLQSCSDKTTESQFIEFEMESQDGAKRAGGIYISKHAKEGTPVIYMCDGLIFKECGFKHMIDSLIDNKCISPVVVACSYENKTKISGFTIAYRNAEYIESLAKTDNRLATLFDSHYNYFINEFIPYIENKAPVSTSSADRVFFGTSNSADFGLTLSMRQPELIDEYWCFSPVYSDISDYGALPRELKYRVCWGVREEIDGFDYFPSLMKDLKKRGGDVRSWVFNGGHDRGKWKYWFCEMLKERFPY